MPTSTINPENATIRPRSIWQKDDCLFCGNVAILEAMYQQAPNIESTIRCCQNPECQQKARRVAVGDFSAFDRPA